MRCIDLNTWPRRKHFDFFKVMEQPHFSVCAPLEITSFYEAVKKNKRSLTASVMYVLAKAANEMPEFRQRIRAETVVEHDIVHPSVTILADDELFGFCTVAFQEAFGAFAEQAARAMKRSRAQPSLEDEPGRDDMLFMTSMPWLAFTSFNHPMHAPAHDSIPRFAWGKVVETDRGVTVPLSVQAHHALMDGLHMGRYFERVQALLDSSSLFDS